MENNGLPSVTVITPTIGKDTLLDVIKSVKTQNYLGDIQHYFVVDGDENIHKVRDISQRFHKEGINIKNPRYNPKFVSIPIATGKDGHYGHRIYAGFSHLVNTDLVFFLDEDNWYQTNHINTLVDTITKNNFDWAYSLRTIHDKDGIYVCHDNCESLGRWDIWNIPGQHLVDTSCYAFKREFLEKVGHLWHQKWGGDRIFYGILTEHLKHDNFGCNNQHTLSYRLDGNPGSVMADYFLLGNENMRTKYGKEIFPWHQKIKGY